MDETAKQGAKSHISVQKTDDGEINHDMPNWIRSEQPAYGVKAYSENGIRYDELLKQFNRAVNKGSARDTRFQSEFERIYLDVCQGQELTEDMPIFGGLVLSGTAEELLELLDHPHV